MTVRQAIGLMLLCGLLISTPAGAALIERDWLAPGDGLLTYDDVYHREWLDLDVSELSQFGRLVDDAVAAAKLELLPGGRFEGFTLAGREQVDQLVDSSGFEWSTIASRVETIDQLRQLIPLLSSNGFITGVIDETVTPTRPIENAYVATFMYTGSYTSPVGIGYFFYSNYNDIYRPFSVQEVGLMLYRAAVPEPSAAALLAFSIGGLSAYLRGGAAAGNRLC